jgi:integrase/recombinase XerD
MLTTSLRPSIGLYGPRGERKYLNANERKLFIRATQQIEPRERMFCLVLGWSGARLSEVLALTPSAIDFYNGVVIIETLKRRKRGVVRQVPLPRDVLRKLDQHLGIRRLQRDPERATDLIWLISRTTAWRLVKAVMVIAGIFGLRATPKGLRHAFGVMAVQARVPLPILQRWLGHASIRTTAIYLDIMGPDERAIAARMWPRHSR